MTTDITELAQSLKAAAEKAGIEQWVNNRGEVNTADYEVDGGVYIDHICNCEIVGTESPRAEFIALANPANILALVEALEKAQQAPSMPLGLHPDTQKLVAGFCTSLAEKLYKAQLKYGYDADWKQDGWPSQCQAHFQQHIAKGDPRDVAAYCAFMWWHGWSTKPAEGVEPRTVTVKLPDYRNTYKSPFADEVEHQVRLALELFSSAAGIKVEAE
ncbi:TPA: ead/Ea22-like family protein [Klebsiella pneumoniae]|uniref:ead/Ea22-like family protein n=1 Tax=Klebsiella pneumoniae TaxID=573 RepID=UPI0035D1A5B2|nr:ead/Ea22-like family protein [Klebsiella pneumoniae]